MSGFDNSQPITDEAVLDDVKLKDTEAKSEAAQGRSVDADELGDATPGPR